MVLSVLDSPTLRHALIDKGVLTSSEQSRKAELHDSIVPDAKSLLSDVKESQCNDSRAAVQMDLSLLRRSTVSRNRLQSSVSEALGINRHHIVMSMSHQVQVLCD